MNAYKFNTRVSKSGTITLPCDYNLYDKEVRLIVLPLNKQEVEIEEKSKNASDFLKKWSGAFKGMENVTDEELDNMKYEYLKEKYA